MDRTRWTIRLERELAEELRDAADFLSGPPRRATLSGLVADAVRAELKRLRSEHTGGKRFPARPGPLRVGRPIGTKEDLKIEDIEELEDW